MLVVRPKQNCWFGVTKVLFCFLVCVYVQSSLKQETATKVNFISSCAHFSVLLIVQISQNEVVYMTRLHKLKGQKYFG